MASYHVAGIDNRGTKDHPCGFIYLYLPKKIEIVGRVGFGAHLENPNHLAIWPVDDTPSKIDLASVDRIYAALVKEFPRLAKKGVQ